MSVTVVDQILRSSRLPTLPAVAVEVVNLVSDPDVDVRKLADTISHDPALSAKILKTVNSSYYAQSKPVSTINQAVVFLGLNSLKTMALGFSLVSNLKQPHENDFDDTAFWKRSLYTAVAARTIANRQGIIDAEEAFMAGLLSDLGILAMEQVIGEKYRELLKLIHGRERLLASYEQEALDVDHPEIGGALAEKWKLPPQLAQTIRWHEQPDEGSNGIRSLARCVSLGNQIADIYIGDEETVEFATKTLAENGRSWFDFNEVALHELTTTVAQNANEVRKLFDLPIHELEAPDVTLARANEALMQMTIAVQMQTVALQEENQALSQKATTDPLTSIANRGMFDEFVMTTFNSCRSDDSAASLLMIDTDHFKQFNDKYGHQVGDRVLIRQAQLLDEMTPKDGLAARYGGEEFAIVLPGMEVQAAYQFAEKVRESIGELQLSTESGENLKITASIGVAAIPSTHITNVKLWITEADQAVYAAKAAGRNCIRCSEQTREAAA